MSIAENVTEIRRQMEAAALAAGRDPKEILLCAATKINDADAVRQAIAAGVDCCGENRVQELTAKLAQNAYDGAPVHFIGHLQTNKVRQVVGKVSLIQSVDSERLLAAIDREAARQGIVQDILLEVNIGGEAAKSGVAPAALPELLETAAGCAHIRVRGLMAIPPADADDTETRRVFAQLRELLARADARHYDRAQMDILSMGMSHDFETAIEEGATLVRVGTAIFGGRSYAPAS